MVDFNTIAGYKVPEVNENVRFNYSHTEIEKIIKKYSFATNEDISSLVYRTALMVCGVKVEDEETLELLTNSTNYKDFTRYIRVAGVVNDRRLALRIVPEFWENESPKISTRFNLSKNGIYIDGTKVAELSSLFVIDPIKTLAYITTNAEKETLLMLNPMQLCPQDCAFCYKGYRHMTSDYKDSLNHMDAKQMCEYLKHEMPDVDYAEVSEVMTLTGRFNDSFQLMNYLEQLYHGLLDISSGKFDPVNNNFQRIKISTHLLRNVYDMQRAKRLGVKRFAYPLEIVNDQLRKRYMYNENHTENKGANTFDDILKELEEASNVFGRNNVEVFVVIGIDTHQDMMKGLQQLNDLGYKIVTYNPLWVYFNDQIRLYQMSLEEIVDTIMYIEENFANGYKQHINFNVKYADKPFKKIS